MAFTDASESCFLDAVASTCQPIVQILPLNDNEIFEYLDAHPDTLSRYMRGRFGLWEAYGSTFALDGDARGRAFFKNVAGPAAGEQAVLKGSDDAAREVAWESVDEGDECYVYVDDEEEEEELEEEQGEELDEVGNEEDDDESDDGYGSDYEDAISSGVPPQPGIGTPSNSSPASPAPSNGTDQGGEHGDDGDDRGEEELMPYPAPAHLVAESRLGPPTRSWALWEEEACIGHMLNIKSERKLNGEARFREALHRMQVYDGVVRTGYSAVKNFWNRVGRARSKFDERRNKKAPLATSKQCKKARSRSLSSSPQRRKTPRATSSNMKSRVGKYTRHRRSQYSSDQDKSHHPTPSDNEEPVHLHHTGKRKDRDGDSDDESELVIPVTKGFRPSQGVCAARKNAKAASHCISFMFTTPDGLERDQSILASIQKERHHEI
ncbi:uncharacterized protein Z519_11621 [Cladophialophora bantiana CBS 173.52]|uniref:Uncharacterized protein n=1 Tax=Cladophialophora bantiana (strain ATCC 10958 / CBS 173.52 / CDC B-1940 / NIH 8579) TaxID=1442370 RepID=A0A0D2FLQ8_CLAB1|nr:uncharacterized protein Z519_11621 [Cladophialophora bantiana CBS 173.52]KIW87647.1 hypothetical protein Z519_11621 [Cladophialophora bantiana CBS 173.52]